MTAAMHRKLAPSRIVWQSPVTVQVLDSCQWKTGPKDHVAVCVFLGRRLEESRATDVACRFIFYFLVTGGSKRSLAVNRMWVYIIRGGQIKKNLSHSVGKKRRVTSPPQTEAVSCSGGASLLEKGVQIRKMKGLT